MPSLETGCLKSRNRLNNKQEEIRIRMFLVKKFLETYSEISEVKDPPLLGTVLQRRVEDLDKHA